MYDWDEETLLAECADVDGLFAPEEPPLADWAWLVGCTPREVWAAMAADGAARTLWLASRDRLGTVLGGDAFERAVVREVVPDADDPALVDVCVEYTINWWESRVRLPQGAEAAAVLDLAEIAASEDLYDPPVVDKRALGRCRRVEYRVVGPWLTVHPMTLLGCTPRGRLADALVGFEADHAESAEELELGPVWLRVFDRAGRAVDHVQFRLDIAEVRPSRHGRGRVDLVVTAIAGDRPAPAAAPVWELWYDGPPREPGTWERLDAAGRRAWVQCARVRGRAYGIGATDHEPGAVHRLAGRHVTDVAALYCALGEAVNGPGGYLGAGLAGLADCLGGGFGARPPFTLEWDGAEVARRHLGDEFRRVVDVLTERGVDVRLG